MGAEGTHPMIMKYRVMNMSAIPAMVGSASTAVMLPQDWAHSSHFPSDSNEAKRGLREERPCFNGTILTIARTTGKTKRTRRASIFKPLSHFWKVSVLRHFQGRCAR